MIKEKIASTCKIYNKNSDDINIIAVSKTIASEKIYEAIDCGSRIFGENYVQEAYQKFPEIKKNFPDISLHFGQEAQKYGIEITNIDDFIKFCKKDLSLNIVGLMAIPPINELASPYFALLKKIADKNNLKKISMGMSSDYEQAIALGSTHIRLGTALFGERK